MARVDLASQFADARHRVATQPTVPATPDDAGEPKYRRLTRKETLVRADQLTDLAALARRLMRQRRVRTERITENSLIRIAIDLLLDNRDLLDGSTEAELSTTVLTAIADRATLARTQAGRHGEVTKAGASGLPESRRSELPEFRTL